MAEAEDSEFCAETELSGIISELWELDDNKCFPGIDYEIDLGGYVTNAREVGEDHAWEALFSWVDEDKVFSRPTYKAFRDLLDNYEMDVSEEEEVTWEERQENHAFLNAIIETPLMKKAHEFLVKKGAVGGSEKDLKQLLQDIWFRLFKRKGGRGMNSCSFEHVFVGEGRGDDMIGLHNWIQFYLQEKAGNIDYHGYFRRETIQEDDIVRLLAVQFEWKGIMGKPLCSCFIGSSPEFEIAAYTICLLLDKDGKTDVQLGEYEVEMVVHSFGNKKKLGTAYIAARRMQHYARQRGWDNKRRYYKSRHH